MHFKSRIAAVKVTVANPMFRPVVMKSAPQCPNSRGVKNDFMANDNPSRHVLQQKAIEEMSFLDMTAAAVSPVPVTSKSVTDLRIPYSEP